MVALPDRADVDGFWAHDTVAPPEPLPLAGDTVSHVPLPDVVQLPPTQLDGEPVTVTPADPAASPGLTDVGLVEKLVQFVCTGGVVARMLA